MFLIIGYFVPVCYIVVLTHELTHFLMFKIQKVPIIGLGLFPFNFLNGHFIVGSMENYVGFNIIGTQNFKNEKDFYILKDKVIFNHLITAFFHVVWIVLSLIIYTYFGGVTPHIKVSMMYVALFNGIMLYSGIVSETGDVRLAKGIKKDEVFLAYLCSFELLTGFNNDYIYLRVIDILFKSEYIDNGVAVMMNYTIDYAVYNNKKFNISGMPKVFLSESLSQYPTIQNKLFLLSEQSNEKEIHDNEDNLILDTLIGRTLSKTVEGKKLLNKYRNIYYRDL